MSFSINLFNLLDRIERKRDGLSVKDRILVEAYKIHDNIFGRFDVANKVPSRVLTNVQEGDEDTLLDLGATFDEAKGAWIVPGAIKDLEPFTAWGQDVPEDLRDETPRLLLTKNGRRVESQLHPDDIGKGGDSLATSLLYGAFPVCGALSFFLMMLWWPLGAIGIALSIPFLVALTQAEGGKEAFKGFVGLMVLPLICAMILTNGDPDQARGSVAGMGFYLVAGIFLWQMLAETNDSDSGWGFWAMAWERFKSAVKWSLFFAAIVVIFSFLPTWMSPTLAFVMACMYPMAYTDKNFRAKGTELKEQGEQFNLGTQGALTNAHVDARATQAAEAVKDQTPKIQIGIALGHLTGKQYAFAPDAGAPMIFTCHDMSMHTLIYGGTGAGKTVAARNIAKQYYEGGYGGAFIRDGKGTLAGEMRGIIDFMIEPGANYAPMRGLNSDELAIALNSLGSNSLAMDPSKAMWENGAKTYMTHACRILEALHHHEINYRKLAVAEVRKNENLLNYHLAELVKREKRGQDSEGYRAMIQEIRTHIDNWNKVRNNNRQWLWNIASLNRLIVMINSPVLQGKVFVPGKDFAEALDLLGYNCTDEQRKAYLPASIHPELGTGRKLDLALEYATKKWLSFAPEQRSSFDLNVQDKIQPLMMADTLCNAAGVPWYLLENGQDSGCALYGQYVGANMDDAQFGRAGQIYSTMARQRIYSGVKQRAQFGEDWQKHLPGQKPVMDMCDECQDIVSDEERKLLPKARSLGLMAVFLTQGYESLCAAFADQVKASQFDGTFQTVMTLRASYETYERLGKRFGTAMMVRYKQQSTGLDYFGALNSLSQSPINDLDHRYRPVMNKMERMGAGKLTGLAPDAREDVEWRGHRVRRRSASGVRKNIVAPHGGIKEVMPIFLPEEFPALLAERGRAIVWIHRAGAPRVDVAKLPYVSVSKLRNLPKPSMA